MDDHHFSYITKLKKKKSFQNLGCCHKAGGGGKVVGNEISTRVWCIKKNGLV
jgi:hypothetical protein